MNMNENNIWDEDNSCYLFEAVEPVRDAVSRYIESRKNQQNSSILQNQKNHPATPASPQAPSVLDKLCRTFNLSAFERDILLLCVGMELDPSFESLCTKANGNNKYTYPTLSLAFGALPSAHWSVLKPQSPLQYWQLIEIGTGQALTKSPMGIDKSILCFLLGEPCLAEKLEGIVTKVEVTLAADQKLQPSHQEIALQLAAIWPETSKKNAEDHSAVVWSRKYS